MKKLSKIIITATLLAGLLNGCGNPTPEQPDSTDKQAEATTQSIPVDFSQTDEDMFTDRDMDGEYHEGDSISIQLSGDGATCASGSVTISGSTVTITKDGTYLLSGTLDDGMVIVDTGENAKPQLIFNGVSIHSQTGAALYIKEADKVFLTLAQGTENSLSNGGSFEAIDDSNIDGTLFSKQDLTLNGSGTLSITSPAGHGIVGKDDVVFTGGTFRVVAASHGLDVNDSFRMTNACLTIDAGKDGIHAENSDDASVGFVYISGGELKVEAEGDGISAGAYLQIADGSLDILAGGGSENGSQESSDRWGDFQGGFHGGGGRPRSVITTAVTEDDGSTSMKGLRSENTMLIAGGNITVNSADDAIHSDASITLQGGELTLASGDDAIHAEDTLTVLDGTVRISEAYEGLEALHIDIQGGDIHLVASDDGLNAAGGTDSSGTTGGRDGMFGGPGGMFGGHGGTSNGSIQISGGSLKIQASGDGIDANGTLTISGGYTTVMGPTQGDTATLDYDSSGIITGGTFIGTGASGMAQTFSGSEQGVIAVSVGNQAAGTQITLTDKQGNVILSHAPELSFAVVILSSPEMVSGEEYTITVGSESGTFAAS